MFLENHKLAKCASFAALLNKQEVTKVAEVDDENWWSSLDLAKSDGVFDKVPEKSKEVSFLMSHLV